MTPWRMNAYVSFSWLPWSKKLIPSLLQPAQLNFVCCALQHQRFEMRNHSLAVDRETPFEDLFAAFCEACIIFEKRPFLKQQVIYNVFDVPRTFSNPAASL